MNQKEVIHLVGDFQPSVLERWTTWAALTNRVIKHITYEELDATQEDSSRIIIMCTHGLNDLPLPPTGRSP